MSLTVTEDVRECPNCSAPAVNTGIRDRQCNACGLVWKLVTAEDELDAAADRSVLTRAYNEDKGRGKVIARYQTRW